MEFHLVAPNTRSVHPHLHSFDSPGGVKLYGRLQFETLRVAKELGDDVVIHANVAHVADRLVKAKYRTIVSVNDYDCATIYNNVVSTALAFGHRRTLSLLWRRRCERVAVSGASKVVCNSRFTMDMIQSTYKIHSSKVTTLYKAVETQMFSRPQSLPPRPEWLPDGEYVCFIGSNWQRKGLDILIRAVECVRRNGVPLSLLVIGTPRSHSDRRIAELPDKLGIKDCVRFSSVTRQWVPVGLWYSRMLALPSRAEALGVVLLEAAAAGLPIVTSSVGGIPEIASRIANVHMVKPNCHVSLAEKMLQVLSIDFDGAPNKGVELFSVGRMTSSLTAIYQSVYSDD